MPKSTIPPAQLRCGYFSDVYFWRARRILEEHGIHANVTMQVFQKHKALLCGMEEALDVLRIGAGRFRNPNEAERLFRTYLETGRDAGIADQINAQWTGAFDELDIHALQDGDTIEPHETVMHISGDAVLFAHLETVYLGILARRTNIATRVRSAVQAAAGKPILFFSARFDHWAVQEGDGYAAKIGGAFGSSTPAQTAWTDQEPLGTVPHALIACCNGNTVQSVQLFDETYPDANLVALVDFDNDCVGTSLACCQALGDRLWGVRLDTSGSLTDVSASGSGVTIELVEKTRSALDAHGFNNVKIIASGGFHAERIQRFETAGAPVDAYGVGSWFMQGACDFTADIVQLDGKPCAKAGRSYKANPRLRSIR